MFVILTRTTPFGGDLESVYEAPPEVVVERPSLQDVQRVFAAAQFEEIELQPRTTEETSF